MGKRILFVNPSHGQLKHYVILPPLGVGYVARALKEAGHEVHFVDALKGFMTPDMFRAWLDENWGDGFDMVGFEFYSSLFSSVSNFARVVKEKSPGTLTTAGGPHPSYEPEETLKAIPYLDTLVVNDGEKAIVELIDYLDGKKELKNIENIAFRGKHANGNGSGNGHKYLSPHIQAFSHEKSPGNGNGSGVYKNPVVSIKDINEIPYPDWDLLQPQTYPSVGMGLFSVETKLAPVVFTRGCPYPCEFCAVPMKSGKVLRKRKIENIIEELVLLRDKFGIPEIHVMDDAFALYKQYAGEVCQAMLDNKVNLRWCLPNGVRIDWLDKNLLKLMEKSGCYSFAVGIESGSQRVLDLMNKKLTIERVRETLDMVKRESNIRVTGFFILGYPGETKQETDETIKFACSLPIDRASFFNYTPFPGSKMFFKLKEKLGIDHTAYDDHFIYSVTYTPEDYTKGDMRRFIRKAYRKFYLRPQVLRGILKELKTWNQLKSLLVRIKDICFDSKKKKAAAH